MALVKAGRDGVEQSQQLHSEDTYLDQVLQRLEVGGLHVAEAGGGVGTVWKPLSAINVEYQMGLGRAGGRRMHRPHLTK